MAVSVSISNLGKSKFVFSTGEWAKQASGSVSACLGDTMVLATACMSKEPVPGRDFFPLMVEYQEKTYAMGKIPGGFFKKEGRPKDEEILNARLIDRPLRPLFPKGMTNEVQVVAMVLSSDGMNDPDVLAVNAASCALIISDIPFNNPVGAVRVSKINGELVLNPTYEQRSDSHMDLVVVGTESKIIMLEGELAEIPEEEVLAAIKFAHPFIKQIIELQRGLQKKVGKEKKEVPLNLPKKELLEQVKAKATSKLQAIYELADKGEKAASLEGLTTALTQELVNEEAGVTEADLKQAIEVLNEEILKNKILDEEKRPDGRKINDIRSLDCKVGVLPRTHGSAVFTRGQTQSLAVVTLGTSSDEQFIEALEGETTKHFMLHYSFPPFSVGEVKFMRGPSRRDIGHGALAEKALSVVIPSKDKFPYTVRVVSEILESNGSSSMASVCAGSLSLMDAGVPIKEPVAGIAVGLVTRGQDYKILTDIAGAEDHYGDMDFKVAGTQKGITAIQLDTKIDGLTFNMIEDTLKRALEARQFILNKMKEAITVPREGLSEYAPKIKSFEVNPDKIGAIIGPGGKIIKKIQRENRVTVDIDDDTNMVSVAAQTLEDLERAVNQITNLIRDVEVGDIYDVKVEKIVNFGAFCEIAPGKSGLLHVSELSDDFVKDVSEFLKEGDVLKVKVIGVDPQGKIRLSLKQAK
ncbi:MAG: polyribonucleotide nucleotidyltransferase [Candidatus Omnitrophica bacterium]|nr:polyribonucleotide nucleotidyltransferase [Candidatus Omnitrophota bacterium]MDD5430105.1 polyribonucleotide nucleotidyltransferase [Candidatus Omnitrophota bacterium]